VLTIEALNILMIILDHHFDIFSARQHTAYA